MGPPEIIIKMMVPYNDKGYAVEPLYCLPNQTNIILMESCSLIRSSVQPLFLLERPRRFQTLRTKVTNLNILFSIREGFQVLLISELFSLGHQCIKMYKMLKDSTHRRHSRRRTHVILARVALGSERKNGTVFGKDSKQPGKKLASEKTGQFLVLVEFMNGDPSDLGGGKAPG